MPMLLSATVRCLPSRRSGSRVRPRACAWFPPGGTVRWPWAASARDGKRSSGWNPSVLVDTVALMRCPTCTLGRGVPGDRVRRPLAAGQGARPPCPLLRRRCLPSGVVLRELTRPGTHSQRLTRRTRATVDSGRSHRQHLSGHRSWCAPASTSEAANRGLTGLPAGPPYHARICDDN
jgi:hypothetical protein